MPTEQKTIRKLRAILSADVKGYSLLMADNEAQTIQTLKAYRQIMFDLILQHSGRVIDSPGDNLLAEFGSAVDAIESAVDIQKRLKKENAGFADDKKLEFRMGINIGDVVQDEDRIYGSGVNIAARIEGLADPGGICISRNAYDHIKDKLKLGYEYLGQHEVKNIKDPVRVYKVLSGPEDAGKLIGEEPKREKKNWILPVVIVAAIIVASIVWHFYQSTMKPDFEPASAEKMAYPLPDKPTIAVLAFDNLSGDPKQEYFSDGIAEDIITALSKTPKLFVIARNSTFTYKGKPVKVQEVGRDLGVRYVLEGSVRKVGEKVRITAQLVDAKTGHHLWAEKYDRNLKDIFALQDEITKEIITALQVKLTDGEQARIRAGGTDNLKAYLNALEARKLYIRWNMEDNHKARELLKEAIELDPQYVYAYVVLGLTHVMDVHLGATKSKKDSITKAVELSKKALSIDNSSGYAHMLAGNVNYLTKQYEKAIREYERAVEFIPNGADACAFLARGLDLIGKTEEAILMSKKAMRLNPIPPNWYIVTRTAMYRNIKNYDEALIWAEKAVKRQPRNFFARINRCSVYSLTGRIEEARLEANEVMKLNPKFSLKRLENSIPYKNPEVKKRYIEALRNAGIPD